jgi:putative transposase
VSHKTSGYASDVTDEPWAVLEPLIAVYKWGRPGILNRRDVVNAIFYVTKTGCQWHRLPKDYPNPNRVYHPCRRWSEDGLWEAMNTALRPQVCQDDDREAQPRAAGMDSQSVKTTSVGGEERGFEGGKLVQGRKRHRLVDTMGHLIKVFCRAANLSDIKGAVELLKALPDTWWERLERIWADGSYRGDLAESIKDTYQATLDITLPADNVKGFQVIPWRWVVERTVAWLGNFRRLSKDYEFFA